MFEIWICLRSVGGSMVGELKILGLQQKDRKAKYNSIVQVMNQMKQNIDHLTQHVKNKYILTFIQK